MKCTRAAIVEYRVVPTPRAPEGPDVPEEAMVSLTLEAHVRRALLTVEPGGTGWPDAIARPLLEAKAIPVLTTRQKLAPDRALWQEWHSRVREREEITAQWRAVVTRLTSAVPRKRLSALVEGHVPGEDRRLMRFGQQVERMLELPADSSGLARCQAVIERLGAWVDAVAMIETVEHYYRLVTRIAEDAAVMRADLREQYAALPGKVEAEFHDEARRGFCIPEARCAFLDDTLFVFDGQFAPEEMRMLMAEYLEDLRKRMTESTIALDWKRDLSEAERPGEIPERVRALVWRRDQGRCVVCQATSDLEFDHIIPRSLGGASTVGNVQVLCVRCNERKGAQVARLAALRDERGKEATLNLFQNPPSSSRPKRRQTRRRKDAGGGEAR